MCISNMVLEHFDLVILSIYTVLEHKSRPKSRKSCRYIGLIHMTNGGDTIWVAMRRVSKQCSQRCDQSSVGLICDNAILNINWVGVCIKYHSRCSLVFSTGALPHLVANPPFEWNFYSLWALHGKEKHVAVQSGIQYIQFWGSFTFC